MLRLWRTWSLASPVTEVTSVTRRYEVSLSARGGRIDRQALAGAAIERIEHPARLDARASLFGGDHDLPTARRLELNLQFALERGEVLMTGPGQNADQVGIFKMKRFGRRLARAARF